jgi:hypothetical protein
LNGEKTVLEAKTDTEARNNLESDDSGVGGGGSNGVEETETDSSDGWSDVSANIKN